LEELASRSSPQFPSNPSSPTFSTFIAGIEDADPNDPSIDEDQTNQSWGHQQFTRNGGLNAATQSWESVGNVDAACRLVAGALKTARVARYLCVQRRVLASSYTADAYVDRVVDVLWALVKPDAVQVCSPYPFSAALTAIGIQVGVDQESTADPGGKLPGPSPSASAAALKVCNTSCSNSEVLTSEIWYTIRL
jgi:hypothetical protein